jgi:DNA repair protein RecO
MYAKITTPALVLDTHILREADKSVLVFTRELGVLYGIVKGVRKPLSKHKATFLRGGHIRVDIVRGKEVWRLTSGVIVSGYTEFATKESRSAWARVSELVKRLCPSDGAHETLFDFLVAMRLMLAHTGAESVPYVEVAVVLGILTHLGYSDTSFFETLGDIPERDVCIDYIKKDMANHVSAINSRLRATGL